MDLEDIEQTLATWERTADLNPEARNAIAHELRPKNVPKGRRVRPDHLNDRLWLLVEGSIVRVRDGHPERLQAHIGLGDAIEVFDLGESNEHFVITESDCQTLLISREILQRSQTAQLETNTVALDEDDAALFAELYDLITSERLKLPTMPEVAMRVQRLSDDPEATAGDLTETIQRDGAIAGALIQAVNSPLFRAAEPIQTVRDAVVRLGFKNTSMLALNMSLRSVFKAKSPASKTVMHDVWVESVLLSTFAFGLAAELGRGLLRERALLAGLVARIGAIPVIQFLEMRSIKLDERQLRTQVERFQNITGALVTNYWRLGEDLVEVCEAYDDWTHVPEGEAIDYASIVVLARYEMLVHLGQPTPDPAEIPAFGALGITPPEAGESIPLLQSRAAELAAMRSVLGG
ncbi:MAG: HDOD domain-containing protein [Thioalkalivibrionaceae bacterium]